MLSFFTDNSVRSHFYLFVIAIIFLLFFIWYAFLYEHKNNMNNKFLTLPDMKNLTHDESVWYVDGKSTCVGYGNKEENCPKHESYCCGDTTFGDMKSQIFAVEHAIRNKGIHPDCPIIYKI